jgi:PAP2 superfamily protein
MSPSSIIQALAAWQIASFLFFIYISVVALSRPSAPSRRRSLSLAIIGLVWTSVSALLAPRAWLNQTVLPPVLLLLGYWSSGALFVAPMPRAEAIFLAADRALGIPLGPPPRLLAECLEAAYLSIYAVVGIAFVLFMTLTPEPRADRFWSVVLITDYICFAMLPWLQTRPPRMLEAGEPWCSAIRGLNLRLLGSASIHVNTWPSGHAAEAAAAALLVLGAPVSAVVGLAIVGMAISAGAVLGRYHYAPDAVAGWLVAVAVWSLVP